MMKPFISAILSAIISITVISCIPAISVKGVPSQENAIFMYIDSQTAMAYGEVCYIDEENKEVTPISENGQALVPIRFIAEKLGMTVEYTDDPPQAVLKYNGNLITFRIDTTKYEVNGEEKSYDSEISDTASRVINEWTYIPLYAFASATGKECYYERGLIAISDKKIDTDKARLDEIIAKINVLPTVDNAEFLSTLLDTDLNRGIYLNDGTQITYQMSVAPTSQALPTGVAGNTTGISAAGISAEAAKSSGDFSQTNVQVEGVDESDIVKTDGEYIYTISNGRIIIAKINPVDNMSITGIINDNAADTISSFSPSEMYISDNRLIAIGSYYENASRIKDSAVSGKQRYMTKNTLRVAVYDITDRANPSLERTLDIPGSYVSSRGIGNIIYIISNEYLHGNFYPVDGKEITGDAATVYSDSAADSQITIGYDSMKYFPSSRNSSFLTIASIDITRPDQPAKVETILGGGNNVYCSEDNLYVATSKYGEDSSKTAVFKFSLNGGMITYLSKCDADGDILNQFSMDEYGGQFRIATTVDDYRSGSRYNNLYIFDDTMKPRGSIKNIAPEEKIYSVRFVGDRAYIVTFKNVDPLFVLDLSDIDNPSILGQLKIPGYSDYLHPIDANHIIGFGKDTAEKKSYYGNSEASTAFYQGMKMAVFDVTDVTDPIQEHVEIIGGRGTDSELLRNHKALLYMPDKNLLAFPVTVYTEADSDDITSYGEFEFCGAYVYDFNAENGFKLQGKITQYTDEDILKFGYFHDYKKAVNRILYANGNLFTTSNTEIHAHKAEDISYLGKLVIE